MAGVVNGAHTERKYGSREGVVNGAPRGDSGSCAGVDRLRGVYPEGSE